MTETRIRWTDDDPSREYAAFTGSVGPSGWNWVPFGIYEEMDGPVAGLRTYFLTSGLPGQDRRRHFGHPDDLKAEAERWLERFVSSLGASFEAEPDYSAVTRFEVIDHTTDSGRLVSYSPDVARSVVARGVKVDLAFQDDGRTVKAFLADPRTAATAPEEEER